MRKLKQESFWKITSDHLLCWDREGKESQTGNAQLEKTDKWNYIIINNVQQMVWIFVPSKTHAEI